MKHLISIIGLGALYALYSAISYLFLPLYN